MAAFARHKAGIVRWILGLFCCAALCGCEQAPLLSQREVVNAVFFESQNNGCKVLLLVADHTSSEQETQAGFRAVEGAGKTQAQALAAAEDALDGQVFYGLMDLAVVPVSYGWEEVTEIGRLLYQNAKPAPQITLLMTERLPDGEKAGELYTEMKDGVARYGLTNGLQELFSAQNECALPIWQGTGYGFSILQKGQQASRWNEKLAAQLAAVLCGQTDRIMCTFDQGKIALQTKVMVQAEVSGRETVVHLTLVEPELQDLENIGYSDSQLQALLCDELQQAYAEMTADSYKGSFDPFHTRIQRFSVVGREKTIPVPALCLHLES